MDYSNVKSKDFQLSFTSDVPDELKNKINFVFQDNSLSSSLNSNFIKVSGFTIETYDIFSGKALRALEVEVKSSISLTITIGNKSNKKKLMAMKRYNANELNCILNKKINDISWKNDKIKYLKTLLASAEVGPCLIEDKKHNALYILNHFEYDSDTLKQEYDRDVEEGKKIVFPQNYYPDDDTKNNPKNRWRSHAHLLYGNWINEIYQTTPYDLNFIGSNKL